MKKYRIKSRNSHDGSIFYIVQERILLFFWYTFTEGKHPLEFNKTFNSLKDARDYVRKQKDFQINYKRKTTTEYL